ncbi:MAG: type II toxin-antitoxin system death-on-curing family toxin [Thermodesulfovibrio sp.]|nr:type II toxin-antitoxin system death-on-curing family toxin [Thermodesulfovibrio sp.]
MRYLTAEQILFIHSRLIDETGGIHGIRDVTLLLSAVSRPKATFEKKGLYPDIFHKTAVLMESLIKNHPFVDGNKRTAITSAGIFLQRNGYYLNASQLELERFAFDMATGKVSIFKAVEWFKKHSVKTGLP